MLPGATSVSETMTSNAKVDKIDAIDGWIEIKNLIISSDRQRKEFSDLAGMMESVKQHGLIQPIVVTTVEGQPEKRKLVAGERRTRACTMLGWKKIPYILKENLSLLQQEEMELEENVRRAGLTMMEEADALYRIDQLKKKIYGVGGPNEGSGVDSTGWNVDKTAQLVNQKRSTVARKIKVARDIRANPELLKLVENLPLSAAVKRIEQAKKVKRAEKNVASGKIMFSTDIKEGDCRVLIKELQDASIDLIITDPPFGLDEIEDSRQKGGQGESQTYTAQLSESDNLTLDKAIVLMNEMFVEYNRVLKPGRHFYVFCSTTLAPFLYKGIADAGLEAQQSLLIWNKNRTTTPGRGYEYASCYEPIIFGWKPPRSRMLTSPSQNILEFSPLHASKKVHPFEKPPKLIQFLIEQSSVLGEKILDTFAGSGRTIREAKKLQRSAVGFELNRERFVQAQVVLSLPEVDENGGK